MFVAHGESSTALAQPVENLGQLCHKYDIIHCTSIIINDDMSLFIDIIVCWLLMLLPLWVVCHSIWTNGVLK